MKPFLPLLACISLATISQASLLLISETFGGDGTGNLNGTTADTFDPAITAAGGSNVWNARTDLLMFRDNGTTNGSLGTTGTSSSAALLNLGSYINAAKGTANGHFTFEATLTAPASTGTSRFASFGLFNGDQVLAGQQFASPNHRGLAHAIIRPANSDAVAYFAGPGSSNTAGNSGDIAYTPASVTFTTVLDLTTHNGTTDFGTVRYYKNGSATPDFTYAYTANYSFEQIGFTILNGADTQISNFTLTQIPEPSSLVLLGVALAAMVGFRRRKVTK